ncbi:MORN1-like protein [Mya arenaria]|uniref:MORN1-like protein n=1 Tax=Mya arenaria TaxID=6604 RepID=A0ABY7EYU5_MYAAR|nr:MORN1-like protein [Mya arenaria]
MKKNVLRRSLTSSSLPINLDQPIIKLDYYPPGKLKPLHRKAKQYPLSSSTENFSKEDGEADFSVKVKKYTRNSTKASLEQLSFIAKTSVIEEDRESVRKGSYEYDNKFFKYEGQWKNGKKHGTFVNGEITGFGTRFFPSTGCKYQGQLVKGELWGKGRMTWPDGSIFEGQWESNKRHGFGVMKSIKENCLYKGSYVGNRRHGQGTMIYP